MKSSLPAEERGLKPMFRRLLRHGHCVAPRRERGLKHRASLSLAECQRAAAAVIQALRHAGLSGQSQAVRVQREPFEPNGSRVEPFAGNTRFSKHSLWHVEIEFTTPVSGPLVIGNGRFLGLGLMAPVRGQ